MVDLQNASFDLLVNGSIIEAAVKSYEEGWLMGGVIWFWPIMLLFLLIIVALKSESPTMVAIFAILGNVALRSRLDQISDVIFGLVVILSVLVWFFSLFISRKIE